jgi:hypothetical protein
MEALAKECNKNFGLFPRSILIIPLGRITDYDRRMIHRSAASDFGRWENYLSGEIHIIGLYTNLCPQTPGLTSRAEVWTSNSFLIQSGRAFLGPSRTRKTFFSRKRSKIRSSAKQKPFLGSQLGLAPKKHSSSRDLLFPEKEAKSVSSASQKNMGHPNLGEADPGGLGASPQESFV